MQSWSAVRLGNKTFRAFLKCFRVLFFYAIRTEAYNQTRKGCVCMMYQKSVQEAEKELRTDLSQGLTPEEAAKRLRKRPQ